LEPTHAAAASSVFAAAFPASVGGAIAIQRRQARERGFPAGHRARARARARAAVQYAVPAGGALVDIEARRNTTR